MRFGKKIGIIGGGQLGKMMALPANLLGFKTICYSNEEHSPATIFAHKSTLGSYSDILTILEFASKCDFLTIEFESLNITALRQIETRFKRKLSPNAEAIFISQNRFREKTLALESGVQTTKFELISSKKEALNFLNSNGKFILKTLENGYDGKGQFVISSADDITDDIPFHLDLIAESFVDFAFECSVILTRANNGKIVFFPIPTNIHKAGILHRSIVYGIETPWKEKTKEMAGKIADKINFIGTMAVEFFVLKSGEILFNEMAPRPHNSGHFSLDLCNVCQFENHIRAISGLPLIEPKLIFEGEMLNLIGDEIELATKFLDKQNAKLHLYGKQSVKEKRKMGHINFIYDETSS